MLWHPTFHDNLKICFWHIKPVSGTYEKCPKIHFNISTSIGINTILLLYTIMNNNLVVVFLFSPFHLLLDAPSIHDICYYGENCNLIEKPKCKKKVTWTILPFDGPSTMDHDSWTTIRIGFEYKHLII